MLDDLNETTPVLPYAAVYGDILRLIIQRYIAGRLHNLKGPKTPFCYSANQYVSHSSVREGHLG